MTRFLTVGLLVSFIVAGCSQKKKDTKDTTAVVNNLAVTEVSKAVESATSLEEGGRHLVALSYGISMVYLEGKNEQTKIHWIGSNDKGKTWPFKSPRLVSKTEGIDKYPAIDANVNGSYVAYVNEGNGVAGGYVAYLPKPFEKPDEYKVFGPLTTASGNCKYSFISASKAAPTVVYGWTDMQTGAIRVGVSLDGKEFPETKVLTTDKGAVSGPAVSIEANYAALTYQSTNSEYFPSDYKPAPGEVIKSFPVWMESSDGGKTWSKPEPLLGRAADNFPTITATKINKDNKAIKVNLIVNGGCKLSSTQSSGLVWAAADINNPLVFMMNAQSPVSLNHDFNALGTTDNSVGVVSFKPSKIGGTWTHVVSNKGILEDEDKGFTTVNSNHKYSALPKTKVRAVTYLEKLVQDKGNGKSNIVVIASVNGGQSFDKPFSFNTKDLGLQDGQDVIFDASPCLRSDEKGDVWVDIAYCKLSDKKAKGGLLHSSLPLGINVKDEIVMVARLDKKSPW